MKENFDIEKLERKNIYKTPEDFFSKIQENVLKETVQTSINLDVISADKSVKSNNNWIYAIAASLVLLFGLGFLFNDKIENTNQENTAKIETIIEKPNPTKITATEPILAENSMEIQPVSETKSIQNIEKSNLTSDKISHPKESKREVAEVKNVLAKTETKVTKPQTASITMSDEEIAEQVISSLTNAEVAELAINTEQDVYLDLYN